MTGLYGTHQEHTHWLSDLSLESMTIQDVIQTLNITYAYGVVYVRDNQSPVWCVSYADWDKAISKLSGEIFEEDENGTAEFHGYGALCRELSGSVIQP